MRLMWRKKQNNLAEGLTPADDIWDVNWALREAIAAYGAVANDADKDRVEVEASPIVRLANTFIQAAIKANATDIHVEPNRRNLTIRLRIDGILYEHYIVPKYVQVDLLARYREMAELSEAKTSQPQSGTIRLKFDGYDYNLRVNTLPTLHGDKIVFHITKQTPELFGLSRMGMLPEVQAAFEEMLISPSELVLFAGHTGSGRTTSQLSAVMRMNSVERNVFVIGQELEYELGNVAFVKVDPKMGLTYEEAIAAVRYEKPDVVMLDQITDVNVWRAALDLAHSGTVVLAAVCAHDSVAALIRLRDLGISSSVLASSVSGVLAQRLVRRVCSHCVRTEIADDKDWRGLGLRKQMPKEPVTFAHAVGCEHCNKTGYSGRVGVFEFLHKSNGSGEALRSYDDFHLRSKLLESRWKTFSDDLVVKLTSHVTTPEEVQRVFVSSVFSDGLSDV